MQFTHTNIHETKSVSNNTFGDTGWEIVSDRWVYQKDSRISELEEFCKEMYNFYKESQLYNDWEYMLKFTKRMKNLNLLEED